jgi:ABC-type branched-subunit amino acid transport system ATPase component
MNILKVKNLHKRFDGVKAVDGLSLEIGKGKITGIIGPNGSGKTTLVNLLSGMFAFDSGTLVVSNAELTKVYAPDLPTYGVTRTFQDVRLFEQMTVLDNILVVLTERNVVGALFEKHTKFHLEKAEAALKRVGLWDKREERAASLSYGQRKLLEIARVLAMDASVILFDEPFAGLFKEMIKTVVGVFQELRQQGKTIILIEHNMDLIRDLCDHLFVMDEGKLLAGGAPEQVLKQKEVIEAYLGE